MLKSLRSGITLILWSGAIAALSGGCSLLPSSTETSSSDPSVVAAPAEPAPSSAEQPQAVATEQPPTEQLSEVAPDTPDAVPEVAEVEDTSASPPLNDPYPDAINRASLAFNLSQSAQSQDDWRLVANRWQQAIELMTAVPSASPNHSVAQQKLTEYRRNLSYAREQAATPIPEATPGDHVISIPITSADVRSGGDRTNRTNRTNRTSRTTPTRPTDQGGVFTAPIVRRSGGTPVVLVTFNGNQTFEMIVDTGASGTVITQPMARALNITPVGSTNVATASSRSATFLLGYVNSLEVAGARAQNVLVAIAGPELSTGLLGHDFFGNYDVTVRQDVVEFRVR